MMVAKKVGLRISLAITLATLVFLGNVLTPSLASALNGAYDASFYRNNDINIYRPNDTLCVGVEAVKEDVDKTVVASPDYAGGSILTNAQISAIEDNQSVYGEAATKENVPWQALAALHLRETGLKVTNPENGQGIYQNYSKAKSGTKYKPGPVSKEGFLAQSIEAAATLKSKSTDVIGLTAGDSSAIKDAFFGYNGRASVYSKQAKSLGFSKAYEGSPYVMNRADKDRDPTAEPTKSNRTWGQIKSDGGSIEYPANLDYGAYIIYASIVGIDLSSGQCNASGLIEGGMNLKQAIAFVNKYKTSSDSVNFIGGAGRGCAGGPLSNCVSFSVFFINKYTKIKGMGAGTSPGNGSTVVANVIARNPGIKNGHTPRPYSIFSTPSGSQFCGSVKCGHTGVILGVDTERKVVIVGEAGCGAGLSWDTAREYPLAQFDSSAYTYAYTDGLLSNKDGLE